MTKVTEADLELGLELLTEPPGSDVPTAALEDRFGAEAASDVAVVEESQALRNKTRNWTHGRNIEGLGIGEKLTKGEPTGELAIRVYVERKRPIAKVSNPVPKTVTVPKIGNLTTDVIELGKIRPELYTERARPAMPGSGLGHPDVTVGTFGCLVKKRGDPDTLYILSNAHVLANSGLASLQDVILQPGPTDGGARATDAIAELSQFIPFTFTETGFPNRVDAAIAKVRRRTSVTSTLRVLNIKPAGRGRTLRRGMHIKKVGRTTDYTTGVITDVHFRLSLQYPRPTGNSKGRVGFRAQVLCTRYSSGGDSGSVVLNTSNRIIGLHFAGSPSGSVFNRIQHVFDELELEVP